MKKIAFRYIRYTLALLANIAGRLGEASRKGKTNIKRLFTIALAVLMLLVPAPAYAQADVNRWTSSGSSHGYIGCQRIDTESTLVATTILTDGVYNIIYQVETTVEWWDICASPETLLNSTIELTPVNHILIREGESQVQTRVSIFDGSPCLTCVDTRYSSVFTLVGGYYVNWEICVKYEGYPTQCYKIA